MTKSKETKSRSKKMRGSSNKFWRLAAFMLLGLFLFNQLFAVTIQPKFSFPWPFNNYDQPKNFNKTTENEKETQNVDLSGLEVSVIPEEGVVLPIKWGDLGEKMVGDGVIDEDKFVELFQNNLSDEEMEVLSGNYNGEVVMDLDNSRFWLDMLWAFGLANENIILTEGEMTDEKYGGDAGSFASTGGWSLSVDQAMNHYSTHSYVVLTKQQQELVDKVSRGIYRPCCGNSTHFPDCNHGMAMLGLLQLMAANSVSEEEMYEVALKVNSYWFPQTYIDLATYFEEQGESWSEVDPKIALGVDYSSGAGYAATRQKIKSLPEPAIGGGGCGV